MKRKLPQAVAGLAIALLLALVGNASGADGDDSREQAGVVVPAGGVDGASPVLAHFDDADVLAEKEMIETTTTTTTTSTTSTTVAPEPTPAPVPEPAPAPAGSVEEIIQRYFGPNTSKALAVARCESGLNPSAMSPGGGNHGLFQINNVHSGNFASVTGVPWSGRYDAEANTRFAKWLFDQSGWGPWACA